jgi:hypothetical protein
MKTIQKCPTCGTDCHIEWSGLELVENTGDETLATKTYKPINGFMKQYSRIAELEEALRNLTDEFSKPDYELFCDHNAGICSCRPLELIEKAKQLLNK